MDTDARDPGGLGTLHRAAVGGPASAHASDAIRALEAFESDPGR